jgi:DNA-binding response OmpR family regulator
MKHQPVALTTSEAALGLIGKEKYDVVISDVRMPGIGGQESYQQVKKRDPELAGRIIFITGDTISDATHAFLQNVGNPHVTKPFMIEDLQQAIEDVLRREESASSPKHAFSGMILSRLSLPENNAEQAQSHKL